MINQKNNCRDPEDTQERKLYSGKSADLHLHTLYSDGTYTPQELIKQALSLELGAVAITDHDTVKAVIPAQQAAANEDIEVIAGIELTSEHQGLEIHILGYFIECDNNLLVKKLDFLKDNRVERMHKMIDKLKKLNVNIAIDEVFELSGAGTVGRLHLARVLVKRGYVSSIYEAFRKYIGDKAPAYICGFHLSAREAIKLIRQSKGVAVLAHPHSMNRDDLIPKFVNYGIQGLEVYYPEHSKATVEHYNTMAKKYGLLATGGSDCHGQAKPEVKIGSVKIPIFLVEELRKQKLKLS